MNSRPCKELKQKEQWSQQVFFQLSHYIYFDIGKENYKNKYFHSLFLS